MWGVASCAPLLCQPPFLSPRKTLNARRAAPRPTPCNKFHRSIVQDHEPSPHPLLARNRPSRRHSRASATMLAAKHEQENVYTHQAGASKQQLQAKTPGARFPKTPLKVPLNDENANHAFGGKSALRTKGNNENLATISKGGKAGRAMMTPAGVFTCLPWASGIGFRAD